VSGRPLARRVASLAPLLVLASLLLYAVWPWLTRGRVPPTIVFYGFSILGEVMQEGVLPAFQDDWKQRTGEQVEFIGSFGGSGTVTNQIIMGVPAELALLSLELDAMKLAKAGVVPAASWRELPHAGLVNRTPFIILVRPGNPLGIRSFEDLTKPGVRVVHPDPLTSGGANWAILAEYGAGARAHPDDPDAGYRMLLGIWRNVVAQASSARGARTQFDSGFGDALITYEQEALVDLARGKLHADVVYPDRTILSEHQLVIVDRNVAAADAPRVRAFADFLWTERAQKVFVEYGFRSMQTALDAGNPRFGRIADAFLVSDFGGWDRAYKEIVVSVWKERVLKDLGTTERGRPRSLRWERAGPDPHLGKR